MQSTEYSTFRDFIGSAEWETFEVLLNWSDFWNVFLIIWLI